MPYIDTLRMKEATMTRDFRSTYGCSEVHSLSAQALLLINDLLRTVMVLQAGVNLISKTKSAHLKTASANTKLVHAKAVEIISEDYYAINSIVVISLCSVLEISIKDLVLLSLRLSPRSVVAMRENGITNELILEDKDASTEDSEAQYKAVEAWAKKGKMRAPEKFIRLLSAVGINIVLSDEAKEAIRALISVRNCIIHSGARADARILEDAPEVVVELDKKIRITKSDMARFCEGAVQMAGAITIASNQFK